MSLELSPITRAEADAFVSENHRHLPPPIQAIFRIAAAQDGEVRGVVIVGRPVSRVLDNGYTLEVLRCCTDGTRNACSFLYGAAWRSARNLGYRKLITYTLESESGSSLRGAGFHVVGETIGRSWNTPIRPRVDTAPAQNKLRWEAR